MSPLPACEMGRGGLPSAFGQRNQALLDGVLRKLHDHLRACDYAGWDPYDGLESRVFRAFRLKAPVARLAWIQLVKRCPVNLRPLLLVPRSRNPKGIALCASALFDLAEARGEDSLTQEAFSLLEWLLGHQAEGASESRSCWGYNFAWQSRVFFAPRGTPNAICTVFVAEAFLDAYERYGRRKDLDAAVAGANFLLERLVMDSDGAAFVRYVPHSDTRVHNVNLLAAAFLARVHRHTGEGPFLTVARKAVCSSIRDQGEDGSWLYGDGASQRWIDNFHTAFNLVALSRFREFTGEGLADAALARGYSYWDRTFLLPDGRPKYYDDRIYPIDTHAAAQAVLTYLAFRDRDERAEEKAWSIARWAISHMRQADGAFCYQKHRWYTNRIPYVRWSQAWMFRALSALRLTEA